MLKSKVGWCGFWLFLALVGPCGAEQVVVSRILVEPSGNDPAYIELFNNTSNPFDMAQWRLTGAVSFVFPDFIAAQAKASFLQPFERMILSEAGPAQTRTAYGIPGSVRIFGPWKGKLKRKERITLQDKNGQVICSVKYALAAPWPSPSPGSGQALVLLDANREVDDWRNWVLGAPLNGPPGTAPRLNFATMVTSPEIEANPGRILLDYNATWSCNDTGEFPGAGWFLPEFNDLAWRRGPGLLGADPKLVSNPGIRTPLQLNRQITYYFRCPFSYSAGTKDDRLVLDQILDDGAVYYLNGKELARSRMSKGTIQPSTLSSSTVPTASEELNVFSFDPKLLSNGPNLLAVEVHQCSASSSDVVLGLRLRLVPSLPRGLVINEAYVDGAGGFVELCNAASTPLNLKGCSLSDHAGNPRPFVLPDLVVPAGGLKAFTFAQAGISRTDPLSLFLTAPDGETILNALTVNFADDGRALGRSPDGAGTWFRLGTPSRESPNRVQPGELSSEQTGPARPSAKPASDLVINEMMFDPPYGAEGTEFIELFNRGDQTVSLSGWHFDQGVTCTFPATAMVPPGGYTVVVANAARFSSVYGDIPIAGEFQGRLRHRGEWLRLVDASGRVMDELDFKTGGDWPELAHGGGSSLELLHPLMDHSRSSAWRDSREEGKSPWRTYASTNRYLESNPIGRPSDFRELHVYLAGAGHVALRNVGLYRNGVNHLDNPARFSNDGRSSHGWLAQGTHAASYLTNGVLHVIADGRGDNRADRVEVDCVRLKRGETYELRFEGRWISGCPRLIVQTWDRSIGSSYLLALPSKLGTPGGPNSVSPRSPFTASQTSPQVDDLRHSPAVPRSTEPVQVSVRVACAGPLAEVRLVHRPDNPEGDSPWSSQPMSKAQRDPAGRDDLYVAELLGYQANEQVVQFYVEAEAANGLTGRLPRGGPEQPALYVVDDRKISRDSRIDRFVVSAFDLGSIQEGNTAKYGFRQPRLSNHRYNMTFISNEERIYYGGSIRVAGSPFTRGRDLGKGKWELPEDRPFRGRTKFYFDNDANFHNRICRYLLYQLGHVSNESEWIRVIINSSGAFLKEDTEPVTGEFLDRVFADGRHGDLYRFDDEWWFTDDWSRNNRDADWSYKGSNDPLHYRTEWQKHTREVEDDYSRLLAFFQTYSNPRSTQIEIEHFLNSAAVLQMAAVRGYIGDWDSFTMFRGKNGYLYRPPGDGRFQFLQWDSDLAFRSGNYPFYTDRIASWLERPSNLALFRKDLLQLAQFTESGRFATWLELESAAVPQRPVNVEFYESFFSERNKFLRITGGDERTR